MSLADDLIPAEPVRRERPSHPAGWEPGVTWTGRGGVVTTQPIEGKPDWSQVLAAFDLDPATVEIIEPVQFRTWDAAVGNGEVRRMRYWKANVRAKREDAPDLDELVAEIRRHKPRGCTNHDWWEAGKCGACGYLIGEHNDDDHTPRDVTVVCYRCGAPKDVRGAFVYCAADWQIGKKGTAAAERRILASFDDAVERYRDLRKIGRRFDAIYFLGLGDLVEGCQGHYDMQAYEVELDQRSQDRVAKELWVRGVKAFAPIAPRLVCAAIGGNHGENRKDGKAFTTFADNRDVAVVEDAAFAIRENPKAYGHVSFVIPNEQLTVTLDVAGLIVGIAHGHTAKRAKAVRDLTPVQGRIREWWKDQAFGRRPVGDADVLLTGHYHHLAIVSDGGRTHMQAPTMDSGSQWWEETAGMPTTPAALTFTVQNGRWQDVQLL